METPLPDPVAYHEVPLVPVQDAGERTQLLQLLQGDTYPLRAEPDGLSRLTDAQHRDPFPREEGLLAQGLERIASPIVFGDHPQAGRSAIHGIQLPVVGEGME